MHEITSLKFMAESNHKHVRVDELPTSFFGVIFLYLIRISKWLPTDSHLHVVIWHGFHFMEFLSFNLQLKLY